MIFFPKHPRYKKHAQANTKILIFQCAIYFYKVSLIPGNVEIFAYLVLMFEDLPFKCGSELQEHMALILRNDGFQRPDRYSGGSENP